MIMYYNKYVCGECGAEAHLEEGATYCPYCGGELYRARSGRRKTVAVCKTAAKVLTGVALPSLLAAILLGSAGLWWFSVLAFALAAFTALNGRVENKIITGGQK